MSFSPDLALENAGFKPESYRQLIRIEDSSFWFGSRSRLIAWALGKYFRNMGSFLEIGCGTGFVLSRLRQSFPAIAVTGGEVHVEGLKLAKERLPNALFFQMDARHIPYDEEFDVVGAFDVLEHIEEDEVVLQQMHRATRAGGGIILTVPQHRSLWSAHDEEACHVRRYERRELVEKVRRAGFEVAAVTSFVSLLLPLLAASRLLGKRAASAGYAESPNVAVPLNAFLAMIMAIERLMIRLGTRFPIGGSLLLAGRKVEPVNGSAATSP